MLDKAVYKVEKGTCPRKRSRLVTLCVNESETLSTFFTTRRVQIIEIDFVVIKGLSYLL